MSAEWALVAVCLLVMGAIGLFFVSYCVVAIVHVVRAILHDLEGRNRA